MEVESCEYLWEIPYIAKNVTYKSPIFPDADSTLRWDIMATRRDDDSYEFILKSRAAPLGEIKVDFSVKTIYYHESEYESDDSEGTAHIIVYKWNFKNCAEVASNLSVISLRSWTTFYSESIVYIAKIRISAKIERQSKFQEQCSINSKPDFSSETISSYTEELLRVAQADSEFCDVSISVNEIKFKAHKALLAAASPVLRAALTNNMEEKNSSCIEIKDFEIDTVRLFIEFIYRGRVQLNHYREAMHLLKMSNIYDVAHLQKFCTSFLADQMSSDNILEIFTVSEATNANDLAKMAWDYVLKNLRQFSEHDIKNIIMYKKRMLRKSKALAEKLSSALRENKPL